MVRSRGRISGSNLSRVDGPNAHIWISGGMYNPTDNLMLSGKKDGSYISSLSARWESYIDPNTAGNPRNISFPTGGMQCFLVAADQFETYSLAEPYGTPTYVSKVSLDSNTYFGSTSTWWFGNFSPDGMYFYASNSDWDYPQTWSLSSAYDISSSSIINMGKDVKMKMSLHNDTGSNEVAMYGHEFGNSGLKMYTVGSGLDRIAQYTLSTAYDVNTASYDGYKSVQSFNGGSSSITWKPDGTTFYMTDFSGDDVHQISVATNWDVTSTTTLVNTFAVNTEELSPMDVRFKTDDGTKMFVIGTSGDGIDTYTLSTGWDISTASHTSFESLSAQNTVPRGLDFSPDGTKMAVAGETNDELLYYTLSSAWTISSRTYVGAYDTSPYGARNAYQSSSTLYYSKCGFGILTPRSVRYINDGDGISLLDGHVSSSNYYAKVVNYTLGESYNALSLIDGLLLNYRTQEGSSGDISYDLVFNNDGTKAYVANGSDDKIYQWTLDIPYTFTSTNYGMTYNGRTAVLSSETTLRGMSFNDIGDRLFIIGATKDSIFEYSVSIPFDVTSTLTELAQYSVQYQIKSDNTPDSAQETSPMGMFWTNSGLFFGGMNKDEFHKINFVDK
jgi:DNA-binding beta-propeller fold protein YncE